MQLNSHSATLSQLPWYETTAGVVELPEGRLLTDAEMAQVDAKPLSIRAVGAPAAALAEHPQGLHVRADDVVWRRNPNENLDVILLASQWGRPLAGAVIDVALGRKFEPETGVPPSALTFPPSVTANAQGIATVTLHATDPGNPRDFIDGQVYRVHYQMRGEAQGNLSDFLSVLVWDDFTPDMPPTWLGSIRPILTQYANLYPIMANFINLGD